MDDTHQTKRRTALKTIGAGILGSMAMTGTATAENNGNGSYGQGNGLGAFLNDEAVLKDQPIWDTGVADRTGQATANVAVGTMTSIDVPEDLIPEGMQAPEALPVAFTPHVVKVSPGTKVTWNWVTNHHSVTSYNPTADGPSDHGQLFDEHGHAGSTFSHTFEDVGNYLYFCIPHGTPYPVPFGPIGTFPNHVGMRGAVIVADE